MQARTLLKNPKKIALGIAVIVGLWVLSGILLPGDDGREEQAGEAGVTQVSENVIDIQRLTATPKTRRIVLNGVTAAQRITLVEAETEGRVETILVQEGQQVAEGTELMKLSVRDRARKVREAEALVEQRNIEYQAALKLQKQGFQSQVGLATARTQLEAARRMLEQAKLDLAFTTITAPYDGIVEEILVEEGDLVGRGMTKLTVLRFVDMDPLLITGQISENELRHVQKDDPATVRLITGQKLEGTVRYVARVADEESRTFKVEVEVRNEDGKIPAGVSAELSLAAETRDAYQVSSSVLGLDDAGNVGVKIVDEEGVIHFRTVQVISQSEQGVWIAGLPPQVNLVVAGSAFVAEGQKVDMEAVDSSGAAHFRNDEEND